MRRTTCIGCDLGLATSSGKPRNPTKMFGFEVPICDSCKNIASQRREDIVAAFREVLRS